MATKPRFIAPVAEPISATFGQLGSHWVNGHNGTDFACPAGTRVHASSPGTVVQVSEADLVGLFVLVKHAGGWVTSYCHLSKSLVAAGQDVFHGQAVALSGNSGSNTTGAHLHITVRDPSGKAVDPRPFVATPFSDIGPEHWGFAAADWAKKTGLVMGSGGELGTEEPITVIRFLAILQRALGK